METPSPQNRGANNSARAAPASVWLGPALLALVLAANHAWPSRAWPETAGLFSAAYALIALWAVVLLWRQDAPSPPVAPLLMGALWAAWTLIGLWRVALPVAGAECAAGALAGFVVFLSAWGWTSLSESPPPPGPGLPSTGPRNCAGTILLGALALAAGAMAVYAVWQRYIGYPANLREVESDPLAFGGQGILRDAVLYELRGRRPGGSFGAPNICAAFLALGMAAALGLGVASRRRGGWAAALIAALCLWAGALTQSRGGALTFGVALVGVGWLAWRSARRVNDRPRSARWTASLAALAAVVVIGAAVALGSSPLGTEWRERLKATSTLRERLNYLKVAWALWSERPVAGYGAGSFELRYPLYRIPGSGEARDPHNWVARIACELGLVGLGLFLAWIASAWGLRRQRTGTRHLADPIRAAAALGAVVLLFNGLLEYSFSVREIYLDFCVLLGVVAGAGSEWPGRGLARRHAPFLATALLAVAAVFSWPALFRPDLSRSRQAESRADVDEAARARAEGDRFGAAIWTGKTLGALEAARRLEPGNPWLLDSMAEVYRSPEQQDLSKARSLAEEAVGIHPLSSTLRDHLASILLAMGKKEDAILEWDRSVACHPLSPTPYADRAQAFAGEGRWSLALADAKRACDLARRSDETYQRLYARILALRQANQKQTARSP